MYSNPDVIARGDASNTRHPHPHRVVTRIKPRRTDAYNLDGAVLLIVGLGQAPTRVILTGMIFLASLDYTIQRSGQSTPFARAFETSLHLHILSAFG
jgi:hypothetical protein